jgi:hypothetical protein
MAKILINNCYGGYSWSWEGVLKILERKGIHVARYIVEENLPSGDRYKSDVSLNEFLMAPSWRKYVILEDGSTYNGTHCIDRQDPDAIAVFEEYGSNFCSGSCAILELEEYDENLYIPNVDEYDGLESLELEPNISEERIRACGSIDEVVELLKRTGAI